jgi:hypothetical protein
VTNTGTGSAASATISITWRASIPLTICPACA